MVLGPRCSATNILNSLSHQEPSGPINASRGKSLRITGGTHTSTQLVRGLHEVQKPQWPTFWCLAEHFGAWTGFHSGLLGAVNGAQGLLWSSSFSGYRPNPKRAPNPFFPEGAKIEAGSSHRARPSVITIHLTFAANIASPHAIPDSLPLFSLVSRTVASSPRNLVNPSTGFFACPWCPAPATNSHRDPGEVAAACRPYTGPPHPICKAPGRFLPYVCCSITANTHTS